MELEGEPVVLSPRAEHFVAHVIIDGDYTEVVCSCGKSFESKDGKEESARKEYDKHYKKVME